MFKIDTSRRPDQRPWHIDTCLQVYVYIDFFEYQPSTTRLGSSLLTGLDINWPSTNGSPLEGNLLMKSVFLFSDFLQVNVDASSHSKTAFLGSESQSGKGETWSHVPTPSFTSCSQKETMWMRPMRARILDASKFSASIPSSWDIYYLGMHLSNLFHSITSNTRRSTLCQKAWITGVFRVCSLRNVSWNPADVGINVRTCISLGSLQMGSASLETSEFLSQ